MGKPNITFGQRFWLRSLCVAAALGRPATRKSLARHRKAWQGEFPSTGRKAVVSVACNEHYYHRFALGFTRALWKSNPDLGLHIHVFAPTRGIWKELDIMRSREPRLSFTWEDGALNSYDPRLAYYFAGARFTLLGHLARCTACPIIALDIDSIVRRCLDPWIEDLATHDLGLFRRKSSRPWRKIQASSVMVSPTERGIGYINAVGATIATALLQAWPFHVDQMTLWYHLQLSHLMRTRVLKLDRRLIDWDFDDDAAIWTAKGTPRKESLTSLWNAEGQG